MKIAILANCQGFAIKKILQKNIENIEFLDIPLIFTILNNDKVKEDIFQELSQADFILMQPLKARFGILSLNNIKSAYIDKVISFPVLYFRFYHPEIIYLRNDDKSSVKSFFIDYHDINIIHSYLNSKSPEMLFQQRQDSLEVYNQDFYDEIWRESIKSLHSNEKDCDIIISDYVQKEGKANKLFHVVNHPSNIVLNLLVKRIMDKIANLDDYTFIKNELLSNVIAPTNPIVNIHLDNIGKVNNDIFTIRNKNYNYIDMVEMYYEFYDSLDNKILEINLFNTNDNIVNSVLKHNQLI